MHSVVYCSLGYPATEDCVAVSLCPDNLKLFQEKLYECLFSGFRLRSACISLSFYRMPKKRILKGRNVRFFLQIGCGALEFSGDIELCKMKC